MYGIHSVPQCHEYAILIFFKPGSYYLARLA